MSSLFHTYSCTNVLRESWNVANIRVALLDIHVHVCTLLDVHVHTCNINKSLLYCLAMSCISGGEA